MSLVELKRKFIGDRAFYKMVFALMLPMIIQNGITNFVAMLDNIMVGQLGTEAMSGVAIANQLIMVFNLCIFGGLSGAGIFSAQFHGSGDPEGVRQTMRFKLMVCFGVCTVFISAFILKGDQLISLYLHQSEGAGDLAMTLAEGKRYLSIMLFGLVPFAVNNAYVNTLRETGETVLPMKAGVTAVLVNLTFNWILIFGHLGFPAMGAAGAAIATVISRFVETSIVIIWTHTHRERNKFSVGLYKGFKVEGYLAKRIIAKGWILLMNELLFSVGTTMITQSYSTRGLSAIAAFNISSTLTNLFRVVLFATGSAIAIIVGNLLGAGRMDEARDMDNKLIGASVIGSVFVGAVLYVAAPLFPALYNTTEEVRALSVIFLRISAISLPVQSFNHSAYFTLRSGGKTFVTFLSDSAFIWVIILPPILYLSRMTAVSVIFLYTVVQALELVKAIYNFILVKSGSWVSNIVAKQ